MDDHHTVSALAKAMLSGPVSRLYISEAELVKKPKGAKLVKKVNDISQFFMGLFNPQMDWIKSRVNGKKECVPSILLFMNGWSLVSEFNKSKFLPDTYVPDPDRASVIANVQLFFNLCQSNLPTFRYQPVTDIGSYIEAQPLPNPEKEKENYKLASQLEPKSVS